MKAILYNLTLVLLIVIALVLLIFNQWKIAIIPMFVLGILVSVEWIKLRKENKNMKLKQFSNIKK